MSFIFWGAVGTICCLVIKLWRINRYWEERKVPYIKPVLLFGNLLDVALKKRTVDEVIKSIYDAFPNEPVIGYYHLFFPRLIIRDMKLLENIMIKDFSHFTDRVYPVDVNKNPLTANLLFGLSGNTWRVIRKKFSPMFSMGKMRQMLPHINHTAEKLHELLTEDVNGTNLREEAGKFSMDIIGSCAFGINPGAVSREESEFRKESKLVFKASLLSFIRVLLNMSLPNVSRKLNINFTPNRSIKYFSSVLRSTLNKRKESNVVIPDFVQSMVELQTKGYIEEEKQDLRDEFSEVSHGKEVEQKIILTDDVVIGQAIVFLLAGFETTSTAMMFVCLDLAIHKFAQQKCGEEIREAYRKQGSLTYESIKELQYLDWCIKESLRIHPPVGTLVRMCNKTYSIPGTSVTINRGDMVAIPSFGIHMDPQVHPDPERYNPERWNAPARPCTYLPFGDGPRICIGVRFAMMEIKVFVARLLKDYRINLHPSVKLPVRMDPHSFLGTPRQTVLFDIKKITS